MRRDILFNTNLGGIGFYNLLHTGGRISFARHKPFKKINHWAPSTVISLHGIEEFGRNREFPLSVPFPVDFNDAALPVNVFQPDVQQLAAAHSCGISQDQQEFGAYSCGASLSIPLLQCRKAQQAVSFPSGDA